MKFPRLGSLLSSAAGLSTPVATRLAIEAASHLQVGRLEATLPGGEQRSFGRHGAEPAAAIQVHDDAFFPRVLTGGETAVGETYMDGLWTSPDLTALLVLGIRNREHVPAVITRVNDMSRAAGRHLNFGRKGAGDAGSRGAAGHLDLGNDFYGLLLEETMTYSCAVFETHDQPLAAAQLNKYRMLCEKARLSSSEHVLEIGCGWGAFATYAARNYGCRVTAITASREQLRFATAAVAAAGLSDRMNVVPGDYRDVSGLFDKIVSIEVLQTLGAEKLQDYFHRCDRLLRPGGRMLLQTIVAPEAIFSELREGSNWMQKFIFPGGILPSLEALQAAMTGTGLAISDVEDIGAHYPRTLQAWRRRLLDNTPAIRNLGFDDRFLRMWEFYLCATEAGFMTKTTSDLQIVIDKAG